MWRREPKAILACMSLLFGMRLQILRNAGNPKSMPHYLAVLRSPQLDHRPEGGSEQKGQISFKKNEGKEGSSYKQGCTKAESANRKTEVDTPEIER